MFVPPHGWRSRLPLYEIRDGAQRLRILPALQGEDDGIDRPLQEWPAIACSVRHWVGPIATVLRGEPPRSTDVMDMDLAGWETCTRGHGQPGDSCVHCRASNLYYHDENRELARNLRPLLRYTMLVVDRDYEDRGVQILQLGKSVVGQMVLSMSERDLEDPWDITDGRDLHLLVSRSHGYRDYRSLWQQESSRLSSSLQEEIQWLNSRIDLRPFQTFPAEHLDARLGLDEEIAHHRRNAVRESLAQNAADRWSLENWVYTTFSRAGKVKIKSANLYDDDVKHYKEGL